MAGFTKLDSGILFSSIWNEPIPTRVVWITILALKDENGFVQTSKSGLLRAANVTNEELEKAITCLESPDPDSRTKDFDGRRIEKIEGGWIVLNNDKYRLHSDIVKEKTRERVRKFREKHNVTLHSVTGALPSVSVSASESVSEKDKSTERRSRHSIPPTIEEIKAYCTERKNSVNAQSFFDHYQARGWQYKTGQKMKDWQAAIRTWESHNYSNQVQAPPPKPKQVNWKLPDNYRN